MTIEWVKKLVDIDTTSRNSNLGLIELIRDYLRSLGLTPILTFDSGGGKANLFCSIPDAQGAVSGGIVLSGHTDVVPIDGEDWHTDPFRATLADGRIYGRGTSDMKGFIGTVIGAVPSALTKQLRVPLHIALSFDEEVGCLGVPVLLEDIARRDIRPLGCIVGEPTCMQLVVAHKGFSAYCCTVRGVAAHSSLPHIGVSAIEYAAEIMVYIRELSERLRVRGAVDTAFDVPYSSINMALVTGGEAINIVPKSCRLDFTIRTLPDVDPESIFNEIFDQARTAVLPEMKAWSEESAIEFKRLVQVPGLRPDIDSAVFKLMRRLLGATTSKVAYGTEAGLFQLAGVPAVVCGPGDIQRAHRANEYIEVNELASCERVLASLIQSLEKE